MAIDTFMVFVGVYDSVADAESDYELIKDLHTEAGLIDAYDAAVIERRDDGKVKIGKKHETPTRAGGVLGAGVGLATGLVVVLFPFAAIGGGLVAATTGGGAILGAVAGHAAAGMSRHDLKELESNSMPVRPDWSSSPSRTWAPRSKTAMRKASKVETTTMKADTAEIEADATTDQSGSSEADRSEPPTV